MFCAVLVIGLFAICGANDLPQVPKDFTTIDDKTLSAVSDEIANTISEEYLDFQRTGVESPALRHLTNELISVRSGKFNLFEDITNLGAADQFLMCTTCRATARVIGRMFRDDDGELNGENAQENTKMVALEFCERFSYSTLQICGDAVDQNWPFIQYIIKNSVADSRSACGLLPISFCKVRQNQFNYKLTIDGNGPTITGHKSDLPEKSANDLKVLQLTDIHYDPDYKEGALTKCDDMLCCQVMPTEAVTADRQAGYWGDYGKCDAPLHLIENAFDHITATHENIDYIYMTGDLVSHNMFTTSKEVNTKIISEVNDLITQKFPNIPVYPCVGNHEPHPLNLFSATNAPEELNVKWLYEHLYGVWSRWLPAETQETILKGGYYTVVPKTGFRIISLNSMDCYIFNFWIYLDGSYTQTQLEWLHDTLLTAERNGEYVHILSHVPSGSSQCWSVWAREFNRIIERFSHIVGGIFNGHTHRDDLSVHYNSAGYAVNVAWNGGSLSPFTYKNPNYRLYRVEPNQVQVVDHETWIYHVNEANAAGASTSPNWFKEYEFAAAFTSDLSPSGLNDLLNKMSEDPELLQKFYQYKVTSAEPRIAEGCNNQCLLRQICLMSTTVNDEKTRCKELQDKLETMLTPESTTAATATTAGSGSSSGTTASGGSTASGVTTYTPPTTTEKDDGASALVALSLSTLLGLLCAVRTLF